MNKKVLRVTVLVVVALLLLGTSTSMAQAAFTRNLVEGMSGEDVRQAQDLLKSLGYFKVDSTGYFGPVTKKAVMDFQRDYGISTTGNIGPITRGKMNELLSTQTKVHIVKAGDTFWKLSQQYNVPMADIISANNKTASSIIYVGEKLIIPSKSASDIGGGSGAGQRIHVVKAGDTFWKLSQQYNVPMADIIKANNKSASSILYVGDRLIIPGQSDPSRGGNSAAKNYIIHKVKSGDNAWDLSIKYGVPMAEILKLNNLSQNSVLYVGQELKIPVYNIPELPRKGEKFGEYLDWWTGAQYVFPIGCIATIVDLDTGMSFKAKRTIGASHADVEPLTAQDTAIMYKIWGNKWSWERRAVVVVIGNRKIAGSATAMPHDIEFITNNNFNGHFDIHFLNSRTHNTDKIDTEHQAMVRKAAGY
ncbi:MAG: LysM peptidoglycan-binding domain-containing protein [Mahellales bacterium]